jgi:quinol monooxygenase YgiN
MKKHMVSYKVKPERAAENERLAAAVYDALRAARPAGLRYATFRLEDGVSFVHIVAHEEADGSNALTSLPAFKAFSAGVKERCVEPPVRVELTEIGAYGFFDQ